MPPFGLAQLIGSQPSTNFREMGSTFPVQNEPQPLSNREDTWNHRYIRLSQIYFASRMLVANHKIVPFSDYAANPTDNLYYARTELFHVLEEQLSGFYEGRTWFESRDLNEETIRWLDRHYEDTNEFPHYSPQQRRAIRKLKKFLYESLMAGHSPQHSMVMLWVQWIQEPGLFASFDEDAGSRVVQIWSSMSGEEKQTFMQTFVLGPQKWYDKISQDVSAPFRGIHEPETQAFYAMFEAMADSITPKFHEIKNAEFLLGNFRNIVSRADLPDADCPVCYSPFQLPPPVNEILNVEAYLDQSPRRPVQLHCSHILCRYCLTEWTSGQRFNNKTCPTCRRPIGAISPEILQRWGTSIGQLIESEEGSSTSTPEDLICRINQHMKTLLDNLPVALQHPPRWIDNIWRTVTDSNPQDADPETTWCKIMMSPITEVVEWIRVHSPREQSRWAEFGELRTFAALEIVRVGKTALEMLIQKNQEQYVMAKRRVLRFRFLLECVEFLLHNSKYVHDREPRNQDEMEVD